MNPVANNFAFTTDETVKQILTSAKTTTGSVTNLQSWSVNTTDHATGTLIAPKLVSGTIAVQEQIKQTLSPLSTVTTIVAAPWTIDAKFDGSGTFQLAPQPTAASTALPSGTLEIKGQLTGTISPPTGTALPTQLLDRELTANITFTPTLTPTPPTSPTPPIGTTNLVMIDAPLVPISTAIAGAILD